jgi:hypothetical protein
MLPVLADRARALRRFKDMAARLRPARTTAIRREAPPVAEDTVVARVASPGQDDRNSRGDGPTFAALRRLRLRNWPTPLVKPNWSETPSLDSAACCLGLPWSPQIRPSFRYVPSAGTQINWLRADATVPGTSPQTRRGGTSATRLRWHAGVLPGQNTRAVIFKAAPFCRIPLARDPRQTGPRRLPRDPPRRRP